MVRRGICSLHFTHVRSINPIVRRVYFFLIRCGFSDWTFKSMSTFLKLPPSLTLPKTHTYIMIPSINMTRSLSLHHLINSCQAAGALSFIFSCAEYEWKLEDRLSNYLLFKQGQHGDSEGISTGQFANRVPDKQSCTLGRKYFALSGRCN